MNTLFFISLGVFLLYNGLINLIYGVPTSLSESYYLLPKKWNKLFYLALLGMAFPLMIFWIDKSPTNIQFLAFLSCGALSFVGAASAFKQKMTKTVHYVSAGLCAVLSQIWILVMNPKYGLLTLGLALFLLPISLKVIGVNEEKVNDVNTALYFMEMVCFLTIYNVLFNLYIIG